MTKEEILTRLTAAYTGPGSVDIVAVGLDGKAPAQSVLDEAQVIVNAERPIGADAQVIPAVETAVNVTAGPPFWRPWPGAAP